MGQVHSQKISWSHLALALLVGFHLAMAPIREVRAAIPLLAAVGMFVKTPFGKALATSLAVHASVLAIEFHNTASATPPSDDTNKRLEVKLNPKDPMKTPAGWTAGTASNPDPSPPASGGAAVNVTEYRVAGYTSLAWSSSKLAAAQLMCSTTFVNYSTVITNGVDEFRCQNTAGGTSAYLSFSTQSSATCPTGYTNSGGNCALSDAAIVVKPSDNMAEIKRVGNVFYTDARDSVDGLPPNVTVAPDKVTFVDSYGAKWETTLNADGTSTTKEAKPRTDGSNKTDVVTVAYSAPDAGTGEAKVTGFSTQTYTGTGALQSETPDAAGSGDGAKESTLQGVKNSIDAENTKVDTDRTAAESASASLPGQLDGLKAPGQDTVAGLGLPTQGEFTAHDVAGIAAALPSSGVGDCVSLEVTLPYLGLLHIAPCAVVSAVSPLVNFLTVALGVAGGIFQILGRREEI